MLISQFNAFSATLSIYTDSSADSISNIDSTSNKNQIRISKAALKSKVNYIARDSIRFEVAEQKVYMFGEAQVTYEDIKLMADRIVLDTKSNSVKAFGTLDSSGKRIGDPKFYDGDQEFTSHLISYNFETKKGKISDLITKEGEGYLHGEQVKRDSSNNFFVLHGKYTTCDLEHPHFYIAASKVRVIPNDKIVTGPSYLVVADIPTPLMLPFGFFPNRKGQKSGILMPTYGESQSQGFFLADGGYYLGLSDKFDLALRGDIYSRGSWGAKLQSNYSNRYKYSGNISISYANQKFGEKYLEGYSNPKNFRINWTHNQDAKARPDRRFSASVNAGSSGYGRYQNTTARQYLQNELSSSVSFTKSWQGKPYNFSAALNHNQNTQTKAISIKLPEINFNVARILPFQNAYLSPSLKWLKTLGFSYALNARNQIDSYDSLLLKQTTLAKMKNGISHRIPLSTSIKLFKYLNLNPSITYSENWYLQTIRKNYAYNENGAWVLKTDTLRKFQSSRDYVIGASFTTTVYGMFLFKGGRLKALRHVLTPTIGYGYTPGLNKLNNLYNEKGEKVSSYSIYEGSLYGGPSSNKSSSINFGISNNIEMKIKSDKDTLTGFKKIGIFDNLSVNSSYNLIADSFHLAPFALNARTRLFQNVDLLVGTTLDPYMIDSAQNRRIDKYIWTQKASIGRITSSNAAISFNLKSKERIGKAKESNPQNNPLSSQGIVLDDYIDFSIPWNLNVSYSLFYAKPINTKKITQTLSFYGDLSITENWKVSVNSGFDFISKKISYTSVSIHRDLHCWEMHLNLVPLGPRRSYNFELRVKSSMLADLKIPRKQDWYDIR